MGHPSVENHTPFAFETLYLSDENARPLVVVIVKATYSIESSGSLIIAEEQAAINLAGIFNGKPGESSYRYEPETAFIKISTDVCLLGHAYPPSRPATEVMVNLHVGPLSKTLRVIGDRYWIRSLGHWILTNPEPFESMPLVYERAFGGCDDDGCIDFRNPVGRGFRCSRSRIPNLFPVANLEDPREPIVKPDDRPAPAGFGFIGPDWLPRRNFAGTYDNAWKSDRMPLLPRDFDRRFFSAASLGLTAPSYFRGDEHVFVENVSPDGPIQFQLPALPPPRCRVKNVSGPVAEIQTCLDTIVIDADEKSLVLIWRGSIPLRNGPHDVVSIQVQAEGISAPATER
jgi:hypothetical protein